jgi:hypothetical protein
MAYSYVTYTGDGSTRLFTLPFPFLIREYIHVLVNNAEVEQSSIEWLSDSTLRLPFVPAAGDSITIKRITNKDEPVVDYRNGSTLTEEDMDNQNLQLLHIVQEVYDVPDGLADAAARAEGFAAEATVQAQKAKEMADKAKSLAEVAPLTKDVLGLAMLGKGVTADEAGHISVVTGKGLSISQPASVDDIKPVQVQVNTSQSIYVDATDNALKLDVSQPERGILPIKHGGTGADNPQQARDALGVSALVSEITNTNPQRLRQAVLAGRQKDGYPAYLVGGSSFLNMEHEDAVYHSKKGTVSVSSEYNTSYRGTKPLRNQVVYQSEAWITQNTIKTGWWQYDFAEGEPDHVLCGLFMGGRNNEPTYFPKKWQLLGWNASTQIWETIYAREADQSLRGAASTQKEYGRMHWFTQNTKAYKRIRINIDSRP